MKRVGVGLAVGLLTACAAPIWQAVEKGDAQEVERLLGAGGDPNYSLPNSQGSTVLMLAAERGRAASRACVSTRRKGEAAALALQRAGHGDQNGRVRL